MMPSKFRPMKPFDLKGNVELLKFPILGTPKLDGIRFVSIKDGNKVSLLSNSLKPIRNKTIQKMAECYLPSGLDGEAFLVGENFEPLPFHQTTSFVMSEDKTLEDFPLGERVGISEMDYTQKEEDFPLIKNGKFAKVALVIFDSYLDPSKPYTERLEMARSLLRGPIQASTLNDMVSISLIQTREVHSPEEALKLHTYFTNLGYEGTVFRSPQGLYKFNRSTLKEQYSLKLKPFEDAEATLVDIDPYFENLNESTLNERGLKQKSKTLDAKVEKPWLGSMVVDSPEFGTFRIGTGFDQAQRLEYWQNKESLIGQFVKFKFMRSGSKDKPRHPVFLGFRHKEDM